MLRRKAHPLQQPLDGVAPFPPRHVAVHAQGLGQDLTHTPAGVQREVGILEDVLHAPAQGEHLAAAVSREDVPDVDAIEPNVPCRGLHKIQDGAGRRRLAATAFADDAQGLALGDAEADAVDGAKLSSNRPPEHAPSVERIALPVLRPREPAC